MSYAKYIGELGRNSANKMAYTSGTASPEYLIGPIKTTTYLN